MTGRELETKAVAKATDRKDTGRLFWLLDVKRREGVIGSAGAFLLGVVVCLVLAGLLAYLDGLWMLGP